MQRIPDQLGALLKRLEGISLKAWRSIALSATALAGCLLLYQLMIMVIEDKTAQGLRSFKEKTGFELEVLSQEFGFGSALFEGISLQDTFDVEVSELKAQVSLNPFSGRLGQLDRLTLGRLKAHASTDDLSRLMRLFAVSQRRPSKSKATLPESDDVDWQERLPRVIVFRKGEIVLRDEKNAELLVLSGLSATYHKDDASFDFHIDKLQFQGQTVLEQVDGKIIMDAPGEFYPFVLAGEGASDDKLGAMRGKLKKDLSQVKLMLKGRGLPEAFRPLVAEYIANPEILHFATRIVAAYDQARKELQFNVHVGVPNLRLSHPLIAREVIGPIPVEVKAVGSFALLDRTLSVRKGEVVLRDAERQEKETLSIYYKAFKRDVLSKAVNEPWLVEMELPQTSCQAVLATVPTDLIPELKSFKLDGTVNLQGHFTLPLGQPEKFQYELKKKEFGCSVASAAPRFMPSGLEPEAVMANLAERHPDRELSAYVPLTTIGPHMAKAFTAAEDSGFWHHNGFEWQALESALRRNFREGAVVLGGSTITMQTAKNLYLSNERTISRKLQETFLTWHLENILPKEKILEIYLNIIEFGPGVYGLQDASRHFFGKDPAQATLLESVYLASVLPSPVRRYRNFCNGALSENYRELVNNRLERMLNLNMIDTRSYVDALQQKLAFIQPSSVTWEECRKKIAAVIN